MRDSLGCKQYIHGQVTITAYSLVVKLTGRENVFISSAASDVKRPLSDHPDTAYSVGTVTETVTLPGRTSDDAVPHHLLDRWYLDGIRQMHTVGYARHDGTW